MTTAFILLTLLFVVVSVTMVLIILVQRPQGGGLAGAFGGAGGGAGTESVFGGRVGDALTWATVVAFVLYMGVAIALNLMGDHPAGLPTAPTPIDVTPEAPVGTATEPIRIEEGELPPGVTPITPPPGPSPLVPDPEADPE